MSFESVFGKEKKNIKIRSRHASRISARQV